MQKDEVLGSRQRADSKDLTLLNDKLYLSQAQHILKYGKSESALNCIDHALGKTIYSQKNLVLISRFVMKFSTNSMQIREIPPW